MPPRCFEEEGVMAQMTKPHPIPRLSRARGGGTGAGSLHRPALHRRAGAAAAGHQRGGGQGADGRVDRTKTGVRVRHPPATRAAPCLARHGAKKNADFSSWPAFWRKRLATGPHARLAGHWTCRLRTWTSSRSGVSTFRTLRAKPRRRRAWCSTTTRCKAAIPSLQDRRHHRRRRLRRHAPGADAALQQGGGGPARRGIDFAAAPDWRRRPAQRGCALPDTGCSSTVARARWAWPVRCSPPWAGPDPHRGRGEGRGPQGGPGRTGVCRWARRSGWARTLPR